MRATFLSLFVLSDVSVRPHVLTEHTYMTRLKVAPNGRLDKFILNSVAIDLGVLYLSHKN